MIKLEIINKKCKIKSTQNQLSIGIDFGTTYSLVATILDNVSIISDQSNNILLPSVVNYQFSKPIVGWEAQKMIIKDPINTIVSVKRLIGESLLNIKKLYPNLPYKFKINKNGILSFITNQGLISTQNVSSQILYTLKKRIFSIFNQDITKAVITVPAYFNDIQRQEIKLSAISVNLEILRLLNEPTAAAIAYGLHLDKNGIIAVYDLGGGTFDISILKLNQGIFEVLSTAGNTSLGGDDFDQLLANHIKHKANLLNNEINFSFEKKILHLAKLIKIKLSSIRSVSFQIKDKVYYITQQEFNSLITPLIIKTLKICQKALEDSEITLTEISEIILVGGSTYIPIIRKKIAKFFKKIPLYSINPDQVVVAGAAIQANMLTNINKTHNVILLDVIPISLGIEVMNNLVEKIILKNTTIPISKTKNFTTFKDEQTTMLIHIVQGESSVVKNCRSLSHFILKDIPPKPAGKTIIAVKFQINVDGLLSVTAKIKSTKIQKSITVCPLYKRFQA